MGLNMVSLLFCLLLLYKTPQYTSSDCIKFRSNGTLSKSVIAIRYFQTCTAASMCDWLWSWHHGDLGLPFRKKHMKRFWQRNLSHSAWLCLVQDCRREAAVDRETRHYLHSSFRPVWHESPHCTRSGSCRRCWCSDHCYRSGHSADTRLCLRLKLKRIKVIWKTWNYSLSPSTSRLINLISDFKCSITSSPSTYAGSSMPER